MIDGELLVPLTLSKSQLFPMQIENSVPQVSANEEFFKPRKAVNEGSYISLSLVAV